MSVSKDQELLKLTAAVVREGLAFVERAIATKRTIRPYENWPALSWTQTGMPDFSFAGTDAPPDYKDLFNPIWRALRNLGLGAGEEFDFDSRPSFHALKEYIRSQSTIVERFRWADEDASWLDFAITTFVKSLIDRYIHVAGSMTFDRDEFLPVYLPLEASLVLDSLPIQILVPILLVSLSSDSFDLADGIMVSRMSESVQIARAIRAHGTHEANEHLLQNATHSLKLMTYVLPNTHARLFHSYGAETFPVDVVDSFFAALRIITSVQTGYAELLIVPVGWASNYTSDLPPLEGTTVRKYPPDLRPPSAFYGGNVPKLSDAQFEPVRDLFAGIIQVLDSSTKKSGRLRLAIKRLNSCFLRENEEDAILDATIGMEVLLSDGDTQEVTHKLALRLAALSSLVPTYERERTTIFRNTKKFIYPYRSAVVHGDESRANKKREIRIAAGEAIPAVKLATEYLGMAVRAVVSNPEFLEPSLIDERLLLDHPEFS